MEIDTAVYPSYRKEKGGGRKGWRTGSLSETNESEGSVSLCHVACYKTVADFYFTPISPPFCIFWAAAIACLWVPLHVTLPSNAAASCRSAATAAAQQTGENQTAQATWTQHSNRLTKSSKAKSAWIIKLRKKKAVEPLRNCELPEKLPWKEHRGGRFTEEQYP